MLADLQVMGTGQSLKVSREPPNRHALGATHYVIETEFGEPYLIPVARWKKLEGRNLIKTRYENQSPVEASLTGKALRYVGG
jgi:hypothetical protein